ncbi:MAG: S1C family serine protease [Nitrososphaeraceae archaeon]
MLIKSVVTIVLVVVIVAVASLFYIQFNDQSLSIFDKLLSLFESSSYFNDNQDFGLNSEAFKIGQLGRLISNGTRDLSLTQLFTGVEKSVVQITSTSSGKSSSLNRFASNYRLGSGFVYDSNSHIITNSHVVADSKNIEVTFMDGNIYRARLMGSDPFTDIAVLYVQDLPKNTLLPLPLGDSASVDVGEQIAAIGNPFGLSGSMTAGIISGLGRVLPSSLNLAYQYSIPSIIQIDAPINPGNSGGPLLDMAGEVIGINSAIFSSTGEFSGIGFAVPSNTISKVVPSLLSRGSSSHPWIGLSGININSEIAVAIGLKQPTGFLVLDTVAGSPAQKARLHGGYKVTNIGGRQIALGGDAIEQIDEIKVRKVDDIIIYIESTKSVGDSVNLYVFRDGHNQRVNITLAERPRSQESP